MAGAGPDARQRLHLACTEGRVDVDQIDASVRKRGQDIESRGLDDTLGYPGARDAWLQRHGSMLAAAPRRATDIVLAP
jgi:hypothetical protein